MEKKHDLTFCPQCGVKLDGDETICSVCGFKLLEPPKENTIVPPPPPVPVSQDALKCPNCGAKIEANEIFCNGCGTRLALVTDKKSAVPPPPPTPVVIPPVIPPVVKETLPSVNETPPVVSLCPKCGAKIEESELFCNNCGARLTLDHDQQPVDTPPPPVVEPVIVPPPLTEKIVPPVNETQPPVVETPVVNEPVTPVITETPPPVIETPPVVSFCPNCGAKIEGSEVFCNGCGTKLTIDQEQKPVDIIPPPVVPPVSQQSYDQPQPEIPIASKKKKGMGVGLWILIIALAVIILGGGAAAFLQYNGNINVPFLAKFIPSKETTATDNTIVNYTHYYVAHAFASTGYNKWDAIVSSVIISTQPYNSKEGAINQFKKAVMKKFPNDYNLFTSSVLIEQYDDLPAAQSGHSSLLKNYNQKRYRVRGVDVQY